MLACVCTLIIYEVVSHDVQGSWMGEQWTHMEFLSARLRTSFKTKSLLLFLSNRNRTRLHTNTLRAQNNHRLQIAPGILISASAFIAPAGESRGTIGVMILDAETGPGIVGATLMRNTCLLLCNRGPSQCAPQQRVGPSDSL